MLTPIRAVPGEKSPVACIVQYFLIIFRAFPMQAAILFQLFIKSELLRRNAFD